METTQIFNGAEDVMLSGFSPKQSQSTELEALRKRSFELLHKFRKVWNESEYQEWCAIQRILHKIL